MDSAALRQRLTELGIEVKAAPAPAANYVPVVRTGNLAFVSGQVPATSDGTLLKGRLGADASLDQGVTAARTCGINILLQMLSFCEAEGCSISQAVKLGGFVNSTADFGDHPKVINGCSDLLVEVLGDAGRHARFALGVANLPFGVTVEIDAVFEVN